MAIRRRRRGFEPVGTIRPDGLGLSASRARELELEAAWRLAAGPELARKVSVIRLQRDGTLIVDYIGDDPDWLRTLDCLLPQLGTRLAHRLPGRSLARVRRRRHASESMDPDAVPCAAILERPLQQRDEPPTTGEPDLRRVMKAYLARRDDR
ncbi:MAG: DUF721 domain-containing protein [Acidobacteriota bacterium]|nr:DUF721 domain-containing protein [Acidobacteriota bacterium]MDH3784628.1 DUF721 domain-containing protein [Acidobacteriota bacterium]